MFDLAKLARECLKVLSAEDLRQLYLKQVSLLQSHEEFYTDINGSTLHNELSKIVLRYEKEGKPRHQTTIVASEVEVPERR